MYSAAHDVVGEKEKKVIVLSLFIFEGSLDLSFSFLAHPVSGPWRAICILICIIENSFPEVLNGIICVLLLNGEYSTWFSDHSGQVAKTIEYRFYVTKIDRFRIKNARPFCVHASKGDRKKEKNNGQLPFDFEQYQR